MIGYHFILLLCNKFVKLLKYCQMYLSRSHPDFFFSDSYIFNFPCILEIFFCEKVFYFCEFFFILFSMKKCNLVTFFNNFLINSFAAELVWNITLLFLILGSVLMSTIFMLCPFSNPISPGWTPGSLLFKFWKRPQRIAIILEKTEEQN